jgi:hypothetical protein
LRLRFNDSEWGFGNEIVTNGAAAVEVAMKITSTVELAPKLAATVNPEVLQCPTSGE